MVLHGQLCGRVGRCRRNLKKTRKLTLAGLLLLARWFLAEWQAYYGPEGPGDAASDVAAFARRDGLPLGMIAYHGRELCGIAALKADPVPSHPHLSPGISAGLVAPRYRGHGIGAQLLLALEQQARAMGYRRVYCFTGTSESLLQRGGWDFKERIEHEGEDVAVFSKPL